VHGNIVKYSLFGGAACTKFLHNGLQAQGRQLTRYRYGNHRNGAEEKTMNLSQHHTPQLATHPVPSEPGLYTLSIDYVGAGYPGEKFQRVVEVPCDMPLSTLHGLVKQLTGFSDEKIHDFYVASSIRGKKLWFKRNGQWHSEGELSFTSSIDQVFLCKTKRKLYYSFEFGDNWIFEIGRKGDIVVPTADCDYPRVVHSRGMRPLQSRLQ
jgi:hypothetical protein